MPSGTRHTLTGTLGWDARNRVYVLMIADGGYWFADMPWRSRRLIGREVTIEGVLSGFNSVDIHRLIAIDGVSVRPRRETFLMMLRKRLGLATPC